MEVITFENYRNKNQENKVFKEFKGYIYLIFLKDD